ncbi:hypothetical protein ACXX82_04115 [Glaciimonas sp. GNP009]
MRVVEADIRDTYPLSYEILTSQLSKRYIDFKINKKYHDLRKILEANKKFCLERLLDPGNPTGTKKNFYSTNITKEFDRDYIRVKPKIIEVKPQLENTP